MILHQRQVPFPKIFSVAFFSVFCIFLFTSPLLAQEIIRKTKVVRGAEFLENVFYKGEEEVARFKSAPQEEAYDNAGEIPDGKVSFIDDYRHTSGEENYRDGKRDGPFKEYYDNGQLRMEALYSRGKLVWQKEYFSDGKLSFEINYEDACPVPGQKETGVGKFYYPDGKLRYEYNFTYSRPVGFQKAYTQTGEVRFEARFDKNGNRMP